MELSTIEAQVEGLRRRKERRPTRCTRSMTRITQAAFPPPSSYTFSPFMTVSNELTPKMVHHLSPEDSSETNTLQDNSWPKEDASTPSVKSNRISRRQKGLERSRKKAVEEPKDSRRGAERQQEWR
ncbi:unnamed protein product [Ranitomeya imitator]|uniref:Uncharacterized protein n=1 Tax=Ranitomeya imitator TaxID=111125 RepID=A0ABN9M0U9_9NEOB|nr:unnamed protein product [Ranitomeya imitator]